MFAVTTVAVVLALLSPHGVSRIASARHGPLVAKQQGRPSRRKGVRGGRSLRSTQSLNVQALVCAACNVESSSEVSFSDHIYGAAHVKCAGYPGFAGLLPNAAGIIVDLRNPQLLAEQAAYDNGEPLPPAPLRSTSNSQSHPGELICFTCGTACSSEKSLMDHLRGATHRKLAGHAGYAGLAPNALGRIPELVDPGLRAEAEAWELPDLESLKGVAKASGVVARAEAPKEEAPTGMDVRYDGAPADAGPWYPPLREVSVSAEAEQRARAAIEDLRDRQRSRTAAAAAEAALVEVETKAAAALEAEGRGGANVAERLAAVDATDGRRASASSRGRRFGSRVIPALPAAVADGGPEEATRAALPVTSYREQLLSALATEVRTVERP